MALYDFRNKFGLVNMWPVPIYDLCNFIAYLFQLKSSHSTIKCYLAGISFFSKINQFEDNAQKFVIKKLLEGIKRSGPVAKDTRLPITKELLLSVVRILNLTCSSEYEIKLYKAAFSLAYHGLLRIGELAVSNRQTDHTISISDVAFSHNGDLRVQIPSSKTDQLGAGCVIFLQCQPNSEICPCNLMRLFLKDRPPVPGPLFCHYNGKALTRYQFVSVLKKSLERIGVNGTRYSSHSFRIGRATSLSMEGVPDEMIMQLGRWKSSAYKFYIRP